MPSTKPFSEVIRDLYVFAGNVSEEQLPFPVAVLNARTSLKKRLVDLQLSDSNHLLDDFDLVPDGRLDRVYEIPQSDFSEPVLIQYTTDGVNFVGNVQYVNKANLYLAQDDGVLKASFYGNPRVVEFSVNPPSSILAFRIYYEPHEASTPRLNTNIDIKNNVFLTLVSIDGALLSLDDIAGADEAWLSRKKKTLLTEKLEWEARWEKWNAKPAVQGVVKKRLYNSRRRY
jgi:hypothetical protein